MVQSLAIAIVMNAPAREIENQKDLFKTGVLCYELFYATGHPVLLQTKKYPCFISLPYTDVVSIEWAVRLDFIIFDAFGP